MKQEITIEQLQELSDTQKEVLRDLANSHNLDHFAQIEYGVNDIYKPDTIELPLLSIGQMIEVLMSLPEYNFRKDTYIDANFHFVLSVESKTESLEIGWTNNTKKGDNICDALWEIIKYKIK